jgi:hypothetical protein
VQLHLEGFPAEKRFFMQEDHMAYSTIYHIL